MCRCPHWCALKGLCRHRALTRGLGIKSEIGEFAGGIRNGGVTVTWMTSIKDRYTLSVPFCACGGGRGAPRLVCGPYLQWSAGPADAGSPPWPCTAARWRRRTGVCIPHTRRPRRRLWTRAYSLTARPGPWQKPPASAGAHTEQHHEVSELQGCASSRPGPLHLGHPGAPVPQCGQLLVTGGGSANTHTTCPLRWLRAAGPAQRPRDTDSQCLVGSLT